MLIIPQALNINNLRTTSGKSINLYNIRKLLEYSLKSDRIKTIFNLTAFEILLLEGRLALSPVQQGTGSKRANDHLPNQQNLKKKRSTFLIKLA